MEQTTGANSLDLTTEICCPFCGYDLRGTQNAICPECGQEVDRSKLATSVLPWRQRQLIGRYRAFWKTVRLVMFHSLRLRMEINCPASFSDAVKFRRMIVLHAYLPFAILYAILYAQMLSAYGPMLSAYGSLWNSGDISGSIVQIVALAVGLIGVWLWLLAFCGINSYFCHPKSLSVVRQNRAIALSYYIGAPLAWSFLTVPLTAGSFWMAYLIPYWVPVPHRALAVLIIFTPTIVQIEMLFWRPVTFFRTMIHRSWPTSLALVLFQLLAVSAMGVVVLVILPLMVFVLGVMILSFRSW